jgi:hypothetical protein
MYAIIEADSINRSFSMVLHADNRKKRFGLRLSTLFVDKTVHNGQFVALTA